MSRNPNACENKLCSVQPRFPDHTLDYETRYFLNFKNKGSSTMASFIIRFVEFECLYFNSELFYFFLFYEYDVVLHIRLYFYSVVVLRLPVPCKYPWSVFSKTGQKPCWVLVLICLVVKSP